MTGDEPRVDVTVETGLPSWTGATHLRVSWDRGHTRVEFIGERENSEPVTFIGHWRPVQVKTWYLMQMSTG